MASLEDMDGVPPGGVTVEGDKSGGLGGAIGARRRSSGSGRDATAVVDTAFDGLEGLPVGVRGGTAFAKAEQVLGQRMERVATAWLEAIDQVRLFLCNVLFLVYLCLSLSCFGRRVCLCVECCCVQVRLCALCLLFHAFRLSLCRSHLT